MVSVQTSGIDISVDVPDQTIAADSGVHTASNLADRFGEVIRLQAIGRKRASEATTGRVGFPVVCRSRQHFLMFHKTLVLLLALYGIANKGLATADVPGTVVARPVTNYVVLPSTTRSPLPGYPQIFRVELNKRHYMSRDQIVMQVFTSLNVVKVTNYERGRGGTLTKVSPGLFRGSGRVAGVPFFVHHLHVNLHYTATTAAGHATSIDVPVRF